MIWKHGDIWEITTGHIDYYKTGCLLDDPYFKEHYKLIAVDLSKQVLDADTKVIQQIIVFHFWRRVRNHSRFFLRSCESILILFCFNMISI